MDQADQTDQLSQTGETDKQGWSTVRPTLARITIALALALGMSACARSAHQTGQDFLDRIIPEHVRDQVDDSVSFAALRDSPTAYQGRTVMVSGVVMRSQRVKDRTEIEVMQVPVDNGMTPSDRRSQSEGRFLATKTGAFLDPAVIDKGSPVTVVGEVTGVTTRKLDEGEYVYPVIEIKHLVDWNDVRSRDRDRYVYGGSPSPYPYYGYGYGPYSPWYYGYGSPWWGPYGLYPYSYYGPYFIPPGGGFSSPPPVPPPSSVPPQFRKSD